MRSDTSGRFSATVFISIGWASFALTGLYLLWTAGSWLLGYVMAALRVAGG